MIAWYGEQKLKDAALARLREHRRLDQLAQGIYYQDGRGCHLGCLTHTDSGAHEATERMFGLPRRVAYWLEAVFEELPSDRCGWWVIASTEAIPAGADLSLCHHDLAAWLLGPDSPSAAGSHHDLVREAIEGVRGLHERAAAGEAITEDQWSEAESAAESAAWSAAESAAWSVRSAAESAAWLAAESAAWSVRSEAELAAWSVRSAVRSAAWSAVRSAAWLESESARSAARSAWESIAQRSIEIFSSAPVRGLRTDEHCEECVRESMLRLASPVKV